MNGRIEFVLKRDGLAAAIAYARQTLTVYRKALADPKHFATSRQYRKSFVLACLECRAFLKANNEYTRF